MFPGEIGSEGCFVGEDTTTLAAQVPKMHAIRLWKSSAICASRCLSVACVVTAFSLIPWAAHAQAVQAREGSITIPTYALGPADPNPPFPLVNAHPVYPYPMLDDLSNQHVMKTYHAVYLENQYLKITIIPDLGGHVYSVYDKLNHREMLYRNNVIKYGLVGPRGAWIAGGMEFSFPYAHTTDTVSQVESALHRNSDGSATEVIGAVDWVSNMYWQIALTLRPDTARVEEGVTLFNATPVNHLYLFWTNTAVKATDDLQYVYPMRETISDDPFAIVQSWPVWKGVDQSFYKNDPTAIAIFARDVQRNFFGVYYHQSNYGVVHVADYREDPGKKLWSWGTAPSGKIWDHILSDDDGSYNEIQSGRFATQGYREFMNPHRVERWTEYWYPVSGLNGGFVEATEQMAVNATFHPGASGPQGNVTVLISPVADVSGARVTVSLGSKVLREMRDVRLVSMHPIAYAIPVDNVDEARKELCLTVRSAEGKTLLQWSAAAPVDGNTELVPSVGQPEQVKLRVTPKTPLEELYLNGVFLEKQGDEQVALNTYDQLLQQDPGYLPALLKKAVYAYRAADFAQAQHLLERAEERDKENPTVAYTAGLVYRAEGKLSLAKNAFWSSIHYGASSSPSVSWSTAYLELGEIAIRQGNYAQAIDLLQSALNNNAADALALSDLAVAQRLHGEARAAEVTAARAVEAMPLLPYSLAEQWQDVTAQNAAPASVSAASIHWAHAIESDPENYIAVAAWYRELGAWQSSDAVLHAALKNLPAQRLSPMVDYYLASNSRKEGTLQQAAQYAARAGSLPVAGVFPNRLTDASVLSEAVHDQPGDAHAKYALGNFLFPHARYEEAGALWSSALRQGFEDPVLLRNLGVYAWHIQGDRTSAASYYARAIALQPGDYRLYPDLDEIYEEEANNAARAKLFRDAPAAVLDQDTVRARHALFLIEQSQPEAALSLLVDHQFKPWEGGVVIHNMYVVANMERGKKALTEHKPQQAVEAFREAMRYPEDLGTGQPAEPELAEQFYWLGVALAMQGETADAAAAWQSAAAQGRASGDVFGALADNKLGKTELARKSLDQCIERVTQPDAVAQDFFLAALAEQYSGHAERAQMEFHHALALDPLLWQARVAASETQSLEGTEHRP
jgi:tetratricopeptide (TPR) repeat protein